MAIALAAAACVACESSRSTDADQPSADGDTELGPLAVVEFAGGGGSLASGGTGIVEITDDCVLIVRPVGEPVLPVWHANSVSWDPANRAIRFVSGQQTIVIRDGDRVGVGGEALEGDVPVRGDIPWIQEPAQGCSGAPFIVDQIDVGDQQ